MNKINWENSPSTNTPLSADNLNRMQDNIEEAIKTKYIVVTTTTESTLSGIFKVLFNSIASQEGDNLTLNNNEVIIGDGITKVEISSNLFVNYPQGKGYIWTRIQKNEGLNIVASTIIPISDDSYASTPIPSRIIEVESGDRLMLIVDSPVQGAIRTGVGNTWLQVKVIE